MKKISAILGLLAALFLSNNADAQWKKLVSGTTDNLYGIQFLNTNTGYAVGWNNDGSFMKTTNGGTDWKVTVVPGTYLFSVDFLDSLKGFISGYDNNCSCGLIKTTIDGGKNWKSITFPESFGFYNVSMLDGNHGYVCGYNGRILYTTDGWRSHDSGATGSNSAVFRFMHFPNIDTGYAAAGQDFSFISALYRTTDGGRTWNLMKDYKNTFSIAGIYFINGKTGFLVGNKSGEPAAAQDVIMKTTDGGQTWVKKYSSGSSQILVTSVSFSGNTGYATTSAGGILKSMDMGETWKAETSPVKVYLSQVTTVDSANAFAAGFNGQIIKRTAKTSLQEESGYAGSGIEIFPNPVQSTATIKVGQLKEGYSELKLYNIEGRLVKVIHSGKLEPGSFNFSLDKGNYAPGVYFVSWYSQEELHVNKLIITN